MIQESLRIGCSSFFALSKAVRMSQEWKDLAEMLRERKIVELHYNFAHAVVESMRVVEGELKPANS